MTVHIPGKAVKQYKVAIFGTMGWMQSYVMFAILGPYYRLDLELFRQFCIFALDFIAYRPISTSNYHVLFFLNLI
jgi:hypothetical protein